MKKIFGIVFISLLIFCQTLQAQVTGEVIAMDPQSGSHNYFGVKVTLSQTYGHNVTVTGYICDEGNGFNANHPFTLTVLTGELTAETATNFYQTDPTASATIYYLGIVHSYAGVSITYEPGDCILKFNSAADLKTVIAELQAADDNYNDDYDSQYPNLTEEELDEMDEQNEFDDLKMFRDFEALFGGFCSKRAEIESIEATWLDNDLSGTDPDDVDFTFDDAENTVFNNSYKVKIGNTIYELRSDGLYDLSTGNMAFISNHPFLEYNGFDNIGIGEGLGDFALINNSSYRPIGQSFFGSINETENSDSYNCYSPMSTFKLENNNIRFPDYDVCIRNRKSEKFPYGSNRKFKLKVAVTSIGIRSTAKGKVVSLKKKSNSNGWKRNRSDMAVGIIGNLYDNSALGDCTLIAGGINDRKPTTGYNNKKSLKKPLRATIPDAYRAKQNEFYAFYQLPGGTSNLLYVY